MKLEVGMYVRYKRGSMGYNIEPADKIGKIINRVNESDIYELDNNNNIFENDVVKASYNIIDILKVGDYVNGQKIYYDEELDFLYVQSFDGDGEFYQESITKQSFIDNIKSVITHEQMEQMAYKVGE